MSEMTYRGNRYWRGCDLYDELLKKDAHRRWKKIRKTKNRAKLIKRVAHLAEWFDALDAVIDSGYTDWDRVRHWEPKNYEAKVKFERYLRKLLKDTRPGVAACALLSIRNQAALQRLLLNPWAFDAELLLPVLNHVRDPDVLRYLYRRSANPPVREAVWQQTDDPELLARAAVDEGDPRAEEAYERLQAMALSRCAKDKELYEAGKSDFKTTAVAWDAVAWAMRAAHRLGRTPNIKALNGHFRGDTLFECLMEGWFDLTPSLAGAMSLSRQQAFDVAMHGRFRNARWRAIEELDHDTYVRFVRESDDLSLLHTFDMLRYHFRYGRLRPGVDDEVMLVIALADTTAEDFRTEVLALMRDAKSLGKVAEKRGVGMLRAENVPFLSEEWRQKVYLEHPDADVRLQAGWWLEDETFMAAHVLGEPNCRLRTAFAKKIRDQELLCRLALEDEDFSVCKAAIESIGTYETLEALIPQLGFEGLRTLAIEQLPESEWERYGHRRPDPAEDDDYDDDGYDANDYPYMDEFEYTSR